MSNIFENNKNIKEDYIKRFVEKDNGDEVVYSPMDPPDAYRPPQTEAFPVEELNPALQMFVFEHQVAMEELKKFETALLSIRQEGIRKDSNKALAGFFKYLDDNIVLHNQKEERVLFPLLHERMLDAGEHGTGPIPETAVDMLEHDHVHMMELAALTFNLMGIASRISDSKSYSILVDTAIEQGLALVELLRLHIFREDNVVFPLAQKYLTQEDFHEVADKLSRYYSIKLLD